MTRPTTARTLPIPDFYDSAHAAQWGHAPDQWRLFEQAVGWRKAHDLPRAGSDCFRIHLLLIDVQKDFCFPEGTLYVGGRSGRGAIEDCDRIARFVYRNLAVLTDVTCTLDTHLPFQIFFPWFWLGEDDEAPGPHREITVDDIRAGRLRPNPAVAQWVCDGDEAWLGRQVEFYCAQLETAGRYRLYLWPPHCLLGSDGHALAGVIHEARLFHAFARGAQGAIESKGSHPLTENYSVLAPEVLLGHDGRELAQRNTALVNRLLQADAVVIAGQAASHCVRSSIDDLLTEIQARDASLARKVYILRDAMSSVAVPDAARPGSFVFDFTSEAEASLVRFAEAGMNVVSSEEPIAEWPGMRLD